MTNSKTGVRADVSMPTVHLRYAWLITWMGTEPWAQPSDWRSIMAIISGRRSLKYIKEVLWLLDVRAKRSGYGMAYYANRRRKHGLPYSSGPGWRTEGSNAWLYARLVTELQVIVKDQLETVQWLEPNFIENHPKTSELVVREYGKFQSVTRGIEENIGGEPFHRWI